MTRYTRAAIPAACLVVLWAHLGPGASARAEEEEETSASGFLGDYGDLRPHPKRGENLLVYARSEGVLAEYERFLIEQPLIYFDPEAKGVGVDPSELAMLADHLRAEVGDALTKGGYEVVEEPGAGTLVLRSAITDVNPVDPKKNVGSKAAGVAVGVGLLIPRVDLGGASIEVEMIDGETGDRVAAVVARSHARRFGGLIKGAKRWGDVKAAFGKWAKQFRQRLDQVRE